MTDPLSIELYDPKQYIALGELMAKSGFFRDTRDAGQAAVKIIAGRELGIPPVAAMRGLHIVEGKVELSGTMIGALIKQHPKYDYRVTEHTDERCTVQFRLEAEVIGETTWTLDNAVRAGLCTLKDGKPYARSRDGKPKPWETYTRAMLFNRAMAEGARTHVPDVFSGAVYSEGEIGDIVEEPAAPATPAPPKPAQQETSQPTDPTPTPQEVVDGELVEEGAEEQPAENQAAVESAGPEDAPAPSSDDVAAGEANEEPLPGSASDAASPVVTIDEIVGRLGWGAGKTLIFLRKPGHLGRDAIKQPKWSLLSDDDAVKAAALLQAVAEGKHTCDEKCDEKGPES